MADSVANTTLFNGTRRMVVSNAFTIDGTEATVILVDKSAFTGPDGTEPGRLVIEHIDYNVQGMQVSLFFDHTTDDEIAILEGHGQLDFTGDEQFQGFIDPASAGTTGDIIATTVNSDVGDSAHLVLFLRKKD